MPQIKRSVGEGGNNDMQDVALVQVLLRIIKDSRGRPYYNDVVSGHHNGETKKAIIAFQNAHGLASAPGAAAAKAVAGMRAKGPAAVATRNFVQGLIRTGGAVVAIALPPDKLGLVEVNSSTFKTMVQEVVKVNPDHDDLRVLPRSRMVYLAASSQELDASIKEIREARRRGRSGPIGAVGDGLEAGFRDVVIRLIKEVFKQHEIVLKAWGEFSFSRDFDGQLSRVETGSSQAGPGEGNHNWGRAMDIGFKDLRWIRDNGSIATVKDETDFDKHLGWRQQDLYAARNEILEKPPRGKGELFRIRMKGGDNDPNHFQAVNQLHDWYPSDKLVSMQHSLVDLLNRVSPKFSLAGLQGLGLKVTVAMTWDRIGDHYECDLGFAGGATVPVGTATEIFTGHARVSASILAKLTNLAAQPGVPHIHAHDISSGQVAAMKQALKAIFDLADDHWRDWKAMDAQGNPI
jgi:hypothetical protein